MPLISKKQELDKVTLDLDQDVLKDSDEIFYCEISKEIFRNYEWVYIFCIYDDE